MRRWTWNFSSSTKRIRSLSSHGSENRCFILPLSSSELPLPTPSLIFARLGWLRKLLAIVALNYYYDTKAYISGTKSSRDFNELTCYPWKIEDPRLIGKNKSAFNDRVVRFRKAAYGYLACCIFWRPIHTRGFAPGACSSGTLREQSSSVCTNDFMSILHPREQNFHPAKCSTIFNRLNIWEQAPGANWANLKTLPRVYWHMQNEPGACSGNKTPRVYRPLVCHWWWKEGASVSLPGERREPWEQGSLRTPALFQGLIIIQFLKQGRPAYKKEGLGRNKGSNQQYVKILNKKKEAWFYSREYIYFSPIFRKERPSFFRVLHTMKRLS